MISKNVFLSRNGCIFTAALVAVLGLGSGLNAIAQTGAPEGAPAGMLVWNAGPNHMLTKAAPGKPVAGEPAAAIQPSAPKSGSAVNQGLKVHGHWIIDIKNPDGTLAQHHEFENSIQYDGQNYLVGLMSGYATPGAMGIYFTSQSGGTAPCAATYNFCAIVTSTATAPGLSFCSEYYCAGGLTMTPTFGVGPSLKLSGAITANQAGTIGTVATTMNGCGQTGLAFGNYPTTLSTVSPSSCFVSTATGAGSGSDFGGTATSTNLNSPISVANGQIIQVTVVLSFS